MHSATIKKYAASVIVVIVLVNCLPDFYRLSDCMTEGLLSVKKDNCT
jgi:hypothetical protein